MVSKPSPQTLCRGAATQSARSDAASPKKGGDRPPITVLTRPGSVKSDKPMTNNVTSHVGESNRTYLTALTKHGSIAKVRTGKTDGDEVIGGDIKNCLSSGEIDRIVQSAILVPAATFYHAKTEPNGYAKLADTLHAKEGLLIIHTRHHWLAAKIDKTHFVVYDSAQSEPVRRDMWKLAQVMGWVTPTFAACPQQWRDSNECGLFASLNVLLLHKGIAIPNHTGRIRLAALRDEYPNVQKMMLLGKQAYGITETWRHDPYKRGGHLIPAQLMSTTGGGPREKTQKQCPGCGAWVVFGEKCQGCKRNLSQQGVWNEPLEETQRGRGRKMAPTAAPLPIAENKGDARKGQQQERVVPPLVRKSTKGEMHKQETTLTGETSAKHEESVEDTNPTSADANDSFSDLAADYSCEGITDEMLPDDGENALGHIFPRSLQPATPGSGPNDGSRIGQHPQHGHDKETGTMDDGRACQVYTRNTPAFAELDMPDADGTTEAACHSGDNRDDARYETGKEVDVGHDAQEHGQHPRCTSATTNVPIGGARHPVEARRAMGGGDASGDAICTGRRPTNTQSDDERCLQSDAYERGRPPTEGGVCTNVVHVTTGGVCASTRTRGPSMEHERHAVNHVQTREKCQAPRALHSAYEGPDRNQTNVGAVPEDHTEPSEAVQSKDQRHVANVQAHRCDDGGAVNSQRHIASHGERRNEQRNVDAIQRPHMRKDVTPLSQLGQGGGKSTRQDGTSRTGPWMTINGYVPTWAALMGKARRTSGTLPLHAKDVVNAVDFNKLAGLQQRDETRAELDWALRWTRPGGVYQSIEEEIGKCEMRKTRSALEASHVEKLVALGKLERPTQTPMAYCNAMLRTEEKPDGDRLRALLEPVINDLIRKLAKEDRNFDVSTKYATKSEIRQHVYHSECAVQFDFAAWFDQLTMHEDNRKFFTIETAYGIYSLVCLAMGFMPSCQVAQACTNTLREVKARVFSDSCVDNVAFMGNKVELAAAAEEFIARCDAVGAILKDRTIEYLTEHDFLGEHYDHTRKTRCLTTKTAAKAEYVHYRVQQSATFTTNQLRAIFGLLIYAAGTLNITLARFHWALRFMSYVAGTDEKTTHVVPAAVIREVLAWSSEAAANNPVPVWTPDVEAELTIYTDASAYGMGAISVSKGGHVMNLSQQWSDADRETWNVHSSVTAEPLAIQRAIAAFVPCTAKKVIIYTDHLPFVYAKMKTVGKAYMYSRTIQFMGAYDTEFEVRFIEGEKNPADVLSRARQIPLLSPPQILNVTAVGKDMFEDGERRGSG